MNKRQAIKEVRDSANYLIYMAERKAKGYDRGMYRDDDTMRLSTIRQSIHAEVKHAYALCEQFKGVTP